MQPRTFSASSPEERQDPLRPGAPRPESLPTGARGADRSKGSSSGGHRQNKRPATPGAESAAPSGH
eukprot:5545620-Lingulodinium_polyedra.AAC.1